jgi:hypothetical protein
MNSFLLSLAPSFITSTQGMTCETACSDLLDFYAHDGRFSDFSEVNNKLFGEPNVGGNCLFICRSIKKGAN